MPLHLLGKKSWNVYNSDNVERVRRDEAEAQARQEAAEQRMQEEDAVRRIAVLRGEAPPPLRIAPSEGSIIEPQRETDGASRLPRKRRRVRGEDDTDRDIRYAKEDAEAGQQARALHLQLARDDAPLHDHAGHIQLVAPPDEKAIRKEKNAEAEAEKSQKRKREDDQVTMRFSNAAGFKNGMAKPWYASTQPAAGEGATSRLSVVQEKDVWGNQDPLRKEREQSRISTNDPFAAMQHAQRQLKQSEADREKWRLKRLAEVKDIQRAEERQRRHERKKSRRRDEREGSLEGFELDEKTNERHSHRHHHSSRRRHDRSRNRSRERH